MKHKRFLLALFTLLLLLTGCAGKRELNELAIVMAVGIDKGEDGNVRVTAQIPRPSDARGQTGAPSGQTGDAVWSVSAEGKTIFEAIRNLGRFSPRRIFWAHNFIIVINEEFAKAGIQDVIDFFTRNPELRMNTWVAVTPDKAIEVVTTITGLEVIPGEAVDKLFRYSAITSQAPRTTMRNLYSSYLSHGTDPVLTRIKLVEKGVSNKEPGKMKVKQVELAGAGVFKKDKLIGVLEGDEVRGLMPFIDRLESVILSVSCPKDESENVSLELRHQNFKVTPGYEGGKPKFQVKLDSYSSIAEADCPISLKDKEQVDDMEKELEELLYNDIKKIVDKVQNEYKADILRLGEEFNNKYPSEWKQLRANWSESLQDAKVDIVVDAKIKNSVLLYNPTKSN